MTWLIFLIACYALILGVLWAMQDRLIFVGAGWGRGASVPAVAGVEVERLALPDGGSFRVAVAAARGPVLGVVVSFAGNGEDLRSGVAWAARWAAFGQHAVAVEYPGYGDSDGELGKRAFFAAADVALRRARELGPGLPVTAAGSSLGTFCAVHLASQGVVDRVVLRAPPLSIERAGKDRFPWLPVGWFLRHDFDNAALAPRVTVPVLILHGDRDEVVPLDHGRRLAGLFGGPVELVVAAGYGHNDLPAERSGPFGAQILRFLGGG